jgi:hypothetical protein
LGIENGGVTTAKIADKAVTNAKFDAMGATIGQVLMYNGSTWKPATLNPSAACSGAIVFDGAYDGPAEGTIVSGMSGNFEADWTNAVFSKTGRNLCWSKDIVLDPGNWSEAQAACAAYTADGAKWRLPHLIEMHCLYVALGGDGGVMPVFSELNRLGNGLDNGMSGKRIDSGWCAEWANTSIIYTFATSGGIRTTVNSTTRTVWTRCVRTL